MSEAKPTPGPCYADGQVVHSDAVTCIAKFGDAYPDRRWSGSDYATEAHKEANAELFADALNVLTDTGLTPSQLVERVKEMEEALTLADLLLSGANMNRANVELKVRAALSKARPNTAEGEAAQKAPAHYSREDQMIVVSRDESGTPTVWCDPEIAPIVAALNAAGMKTVASCSGHGNAPGVISLADGRAVVITRDGTECEIMTRVRGLDVNGAQIPPKGYVFMPITPTLEMLDALRANTTDRLDQRYSNLLEAFRAPKPAATEHGLEEPSP